MDVDENPAGTARLLKAILGDDMGMRFLPSDEIWGPGCSQESHGFRCG